VRDALRANAADVTRRPVRHRYRALCKEREREEEAATIEPWMAAAFGQLVRASETDASFALVTCRVNGKPSACIAITKQDGPRLWVQPLFVAVTPSITVDAHGEDVLFADDG